MIGIIICYILIGFVFAMEADSKAIEKFNATLDIDYEEFEFYRRHRGFLVGSVILLWPIRLAILVFKGVLGVLGKIFKGING